MRRFTYFSSFWVDIESCNVEVWVIPREGAVYELGAWVNIYYSQMIYDGNEIGGCYDVNLVLMKGTNVVMNIGSNLPYTLSYGFRIPDLESASDYNIKLVLNRKSSCDQYTYLPEEITSLSNNFSITR